MEKAQVVISRCLNYMKKKCLNVPSLPVSGFFFRQSTLKSPIGALRGHEVTKRFHVNRGFFSMSAIKVVAPGDPASYEWAISWLLQLCWENLLAAS